VRSEGGRICCDFNSLSERNQIEKVPIRTKGGFTILVFRYFIALTKCNARLQRRRPLPRIGDFVRLPSFPGGLPKLRQTG